jgi:hypothetical protein
MDTARALLNGATELHVHSSPDVFPRLMNHAETAQHLKEYGYRAVVIKCHHQGTADRIPFVKELVKGIEIYGSISLNYPVGGLNPFAVDTALKYGAKVVWLPTVDAENHVRFFGGAGQFKGIMIQEKKMPKFYSEAKGISVIDDHGKLRKEVYDILDLVVDYDVALALGHISFREMELVAKAAKEAGAKRVFADHPNLNFMGSIPIEKQQELVKLGVKIECAFSEMSPVWLTQAMTTEQLASNIRKLGPENVILDSDTGTLASARAGESMRLFVTLLLGEGISESDIRTMLVKNTAEMIGI